MVRFQRLTWDDLGNFTRAELLPRVEAEQQYWVRKERRSLSEADQRAREEFSKILYAVINPPGLAGAMGEMAAGLKGERSANTAYWSEKPGLHPSSQAEAAAGSPGPEVDAGREAEAGQ